nr:unnamed protein product [Digitaria exilis]
MYSPSIPAAAPPLPLTPSAAFPPRGCLLLYRPHFLVPFLVLSRSHDRLTARVCQCRLLQLSPGVEVKNTTSSTSKALGLAPALVSLAAVLKYLAAEVLMEIRVRCGCGESSCPEWAVVELQGVVQPQASFAGDIRGLHIGRLCSAPSPSATSKARTPRSHSHPLPSLAAGYTFTVGYHELAGTKVTLKKPLLVLRKKKVGGGGVGDQEPPAEVELEVIGIIRHKILFKDRPKALISSKLPTNPLFSAPKSSAVLQRARIGLRPLPWKWNPRENGTGRRRVGNPMTNYFQAGDELTTYTRNSERGLIPHPTELIMAQLKTV